MFACRVYFWCLWYQSRNKSFDQTQAYFNTGIESIPPTIDGYHVLIWVGEFVLLLLELICIFCLLCHLLQVNKKSVQTNTANMIISYTHKCKPNTVERVISSSSVHQETEESLSGSLGSPVPPPLRAKDTIDSLYEPATGTLKGYFKGKESAIDEMKIYVDNRISRNESQGTSNKVRDSELLYGARIITSEFDGITTGKFPTISE